MPGDDARRRLRGVVWRGDNSDLLELLSHRPWPEHALQLIGDGLLGALRHRVKDAGVLAAECVASLRERDWEGDEELAIALESRMGTAPTPLLRPLPVDLEELSEILEGDPVHGGGRIDLRSGEVRSQSSIEYAEEDGEDGEDGEDWLWVDSEGSRDSYRDMEGFIAGLKDEGIAGALERAIHGRGPFRRFASALDRWPDLVGPWLAFSEERHRGRARAWLAAEGFTPEPSFS